MRDLFRIKSFFRLYSALLLAAASRNIVAVGIYIFTYEMTHSAMSVIIVILCRRTPTVLFGLFSGYIADHFHKRWVMALSEIVSALAISLILHVNDIHTMGFIYLAYFILAFTVTTSQSCKSSAVSEIVPIHLMPTANTFLSSTQNITMIFGSALGGVLYSIVGMKLLVVLSMGLMVAAAFLIASIREIQQTKQEKNPNASWTKQVLGGWNKIREIPDLQIVFTYDILAVISFTVYNLMITLYPLKLYHMTSSGVGWFNSIYGLATLIGTIIIAQISFRTGILPMVKFRPYLLVMNGFILILMSMTTSQILGMTLFFISVLLYMLFSLSHQNLLLHYAGKHHIGRVYSFDNMITVLVLTLVGLVYGKMGDLFPASYLGYTAGILLILLTVSYENILRIQRLSLATVRSLALFACLISLMGCSKSSIPSHVNNKAVEGGIDKIEDLL